MSKLPDYIETESGNLIHRKSAIKGSSHILFGSKVIVHEGVSIRGDLTGERTGAIVSVDKYTILNKSCSLIPPQKLSKTSGKLAYYPIKLGSYVWIGENATVEAAQIGSFVRIGRDCKIGRFAIIGDCCYIEDGAHVTPFSVISSYSYVKGDPAKRVQELPGSMPSVWERYMRMTYNCIDIPEPFGQATTKQI